MNDAYRCLMDAAASAREAHDALGMTAAPTSERLRLARDLAETIERLDTLCERAEQALKAGA